MISKALRLIAEQVRQYISATDTVNNAIDAPDYVVLGNIALSESQDLTPTIRQRTVLSLVNLHEEATFKNNPNYERIGNETRYLNAPVFLNLFLLFSANYDDYQNSLIRLGQVVEFFQGKRVFTFANAPMPEFQDDEEVADMKIILDLYSMTFEQLNHLWGSLGGKQMPSVMYKARLIRVQADRPDGRGPYIEEITSKESIS